MRMNHLLLIAAVAVAGYMLGPQIKANVLPLLSGFTGLSMRLDPGLSDAIDDRRGRGGGGLTRTGMPGGEEGGGFPGGGGFPRGGGMGRGGPPGGTEDDDGPGGRMGPPGGFPGGMGGPSGGRGGGLRCRDTLTGRDVPLEFCERERGGRR